MKNPPEEITPAVLYETGIEVFGNFDDYEEWLNSKIPSLGNRKPASFVHTEAGRKACYNVLNAILWGIFS